MKNIENQIEQTAKIMKKPYDQYLLDMPIFSFKIGFTAVEFIVYLKQLAEILNLELFVILDHIGNCDPQFISYNSLISLLKKISKQTNVERKEELL